MRGGLWVLNIFAFVWSAAGILLSHLPPAWLIAPVAISVILLLWASRAVAGTPAPSGAHVGRVVGIWSAVEGVAMFLAANVLINLHMPWAVMPVFAIIVGLHFLPLARGIPVPIYHATGAALITVGTIALLAPPFHLLLMTGVMAAVILWASAIALARQVEG